MFKSGYVTVMVNDIKKAKQFYVETLGMDLQFQVEGHLVQVEVPGLIIQLLCPRGDHGSQSVQPGNISIGLEVQGLDAVVEELTSRGVEFQPIMEENAARLANFSDPEGNPLYLIELKH